MCVRVHAFSKGEQRACRREMRVWYSVLIRGVEEKMEMTSSLRHRKRRGSRESELGRKCLSDIMNAFYWDLVKEWMSTQEEVLQ